MLELNFKKRSKRKVILILDIFILLVLLIFVLIGIKRGLIVTVFNFFSLIISILISRYLYPLISKMLFKSENIYKPIKEGVINSLNINEIVVDSSIKAQNNFINNLPLPDNILKSLSENNNPEVYNILNVSDLEDYIGSFIANIIINGISMILVFIVAFIIMRIISYTLDIVTKLPVVKSFNSLGGGILGFAQGILIVWFLMVLSTFLLSNDQFESSLRNSFLAIKLYENNILMSMIVKVFG